MHPTVSAQGPLLEARGGCNALRGPGRSGFPATGPRRLGYRPLQQRRGPGVASGLGARGQFVDLHRLLLHQFLFVAIQELRSLHQNACSGLHHVLVHQQQRRIELLPSLAEGLLVWQEHRRLFIPTDLQCLHLRCHLSPPLLHFLQLVAVPWKIGVQCFFAELNLELTAADHAVNLLQPLGLLEHPFAQLHVVLSEDVQVVPLLLKHEVVTFGAGAVHKLLREHRGAVIEIAEILQNTFAAVAVMLEALQQLDTFFADFDHGITLHVRNSMFLHLADPPIHQRSPIFAQCLQLGDRLLEVDPDLFLTGQIVFQLRIDNRLCFLKGFASFLNILLLHRLLLLQLDDVLINSCLCFSILCLGLLSALPSILVTFLQVLQQLLLGTFVQELAQSEQHNINDLLLNLQILLKLGFC
mmetsp:Transcript_13099/g.23959  ORF Transcript_13099/g.23959 Transcript_13099/m.23959 type:complete len:412 (+) Transcript_13099:904-2139(+)